MSKEFPEVASPSQARRIVERVLARGEPRRLGSGRTGYWYEGTLAIVHPDGLDGGTCLRPVDATPYLVPPEIPAPRPDPTAGLVRLSRWKVELLHGALRDGWNDVVRAEESVSDCFGAESHVILGLIADLGQGLSLPYGLPGGESWYWSQLLPVHFEPPAHIEQIDFVLDLTETELEALVRAIPVALHFCSPEFDTRFGFSLEEATALHAEILTAVGSPEFPANEVDG